MRPPPVTISEADGRWRAADGTGWTAGAGTLAELTEAIWAADRGDRERRFAGAAS